MAEFNDLDALVEAALDGLFRPVFALPLMFFDCGIDACPTALGVDAARRQVVNNVEGDQILFELSAADGLFAQRTSFVDPRPVFDANVAKSMPI